MTALIFFHFIVSTFLFLFLSKTSVWSLKHLSPSSLFPVSAAQMLYKDLLSLNTSLLKGGTRFVLTQYKFFTELIEDLLKARKKSGVDLHGILPSIKDALIYEIKFEKKLRDEFFGGIFQMLIIFLFGAVFLNSFYLQLELKFNLADFFIPLALQLGGFVSYTGMFFLIKKKQFENLGLYIATSYKLKVFIFSKTPLGLINKKILIEELPNEKEFISFKERIEIFLTNIHYSGSVHEEDFDGLIKELWFLNEMKFEKFLKLLGALKLLVIVFFFMGSFMLLMLQVLSQLSL